MKDDKEFSVLNDIPAGALGGMHPETKKIIDRIKSTKGKVLCAKLKNPREAKNRLDALRRARARKRVQYREARRTGDRIYFRVR